MAWQLVLLVCWVAMVNSWGAGLVMMDKRAAQAGRQRVPEAQLWRLAFMGGWPLMGAAMFAVRHKTRKESFVLRFWLSALLNVAMVAAAVVWYKL